MVSSSKSLVGRGGIDLLAPLVVFEPFSKYNEANGCYLFQQTKP
jgi:hypothetical protein